MTQFQIECDICKKYISIINIVPGQDVECRYCNNIQVVPKSALPQNKISCSNCSTIQYQNANYCHHCGESLTQRTIQSSNGKKRKKILTKIIGFIFIVIGFYIKNEDESLTMWSLEVAIPILIGLFIFYIDKD